MYLRRFVLAAVASAAMLAAAGAAAKAQPVPPDQAKAFIQQAGQQLVGVINSGAPTTQKSSQLIQLINQIVAVDQVGDYVLGRYRSEMTPDQHAQFLSLFHQLLAFSITHEISTYEGVTFTVNGASVSGNDTIVDSTVVRPGQAPADVGWAVDDVNGSPKIVDVIVVGTSLRITTRNDYSSVIINNGGQVSALLNAMQGMLQRMQGGS